MNISEILVCIFVDLKSTKQVILSFWANLLEFGHCVFVLIRGHFLPMVVIFLIRWADYTNFRLNVNSIASYLFRSYNEKRNAI